MPRRTEAPPPTADCELDRVAVALRARFDREVASASRPEPAPTLSVSDGSSREESSPSLPPVAAREVPLIRPDAAASAHADPHAARALDADVAAVSRYAREETARLAAFAKKLELGVGNAETGPAPRSLGAWRDAADACARRATLAGDVLEHAIETVEIATRVSHDPFEAGADGAKAEPEKGPSAPLADARGRLRSLRAAFEPVVLAASGAYAGTRARFDPAAGETTGGTWRPPDAFERKTAKYWVETKHVLALKLELAKHLPVLVFREEKTEENDPDAARDGGAVTSVYLDTADAAVYDSRLARDQGATLVRARWYGGDDVRDVGGRGASVFDASGDSPVFVERKTHHESWSRDGSTKERFALRRRDARAFLAGTLSNVEDALLFDKGDANARAARRRLADEIARFELGERRVAPSVRTEYRRVAFQRCDDNAVRVSLDVDLAFADARGTRGDEVSAPGPDAIAFPFAVLEIKTRDETPPAWVERALRSVPCLEVRKFSKFLHATMLTRRRSIARAPHWWTDDADAGVDRLAVRSRRVSRGSSAAPEREESVFVPVPDDRPAPTATFPISDGVPRGAANQTDLESGRLDPSRDDASDGDGGGRASGGSRGARAGTVPFPFPLRRGGARAAASGCVLFGFRAPKGRGARRGAGPSDETRSASEGRREASTRVSYVPAKVEPKTFFANERTLLQWLSMSVLLLFAALALLGGAATTATAMSDIITQAPSPRTASDAPAARRRAKKGAASFLGGAALAATSVAFMAYALWTYLWRARRIARREPSARYDDVAGPTTLVVVLVIVSSVAAVVAVADAARARRPL